MPHHVTRRWLPGACQSRLPGSGGLVPFTARLKVTGPPHTVLPGGSCLARGRRPFHGMPPSQAMLHHGYPAHVAGPCHAMNRICLCGATKDYHVKPPELRWPCRAMLPTGGYPAH
jgi:hypothetical protein